MSEKPWSSICQTVGKVAESAGKIAGACSGIAGSAKNYVENIKFFDDSAHGGHGFTFEKVQHFKDIASGKKAKIVGGDNAPNGADRIVNGVPIQSKCCSSGSRCIHDCFKDNQFRYWNPDGSPMKIEVPSDKYKGAIQAFEERIKTGQVQGVTDPAQAKDIIQQGRYTYKQIRNIAKFGSIEGLTYDAANGVKLAGTSMGITAAISFGCAVWNGEDWDVALRSSAWQGLKSGICSGASSVGAAQLGRTGVEKYLIGTTDWLTDKIGYKVSSWISNGSLHKKIVGEAAKKHTSKLIRGNLVSGVVCTAVSAIPDCVHFYNGKMSGAQVAKNATSSATSVACGTGGWMAGASVGATIGTAVFPGGGTVVGAFAGGLVGSMACGSAGGTLSKKILDKFVQDDEIEMLKIAEGQFCQLAIDYLLTNDETVAVRDSFVCIPNVVHEMFASNDKEKYAYKNLESLIQTQVKKREIIKLPSDKDFLSETINVAELILQIQYAPQL